MHDADRGQGVTLTAYGIKLCSRDGHCRQLQVADSYTFFCSFPGHAAIMKGTLKLVK